MSSFKILYRSNLSWRFHITQILSIFSFCTYVLTQVSSGTAVVEYKVVSTSCTVLRPIYKCWVRETRFVKWVIVSRSEPPSHPPHKGLAHLDFTTLFGGESYILHSICSINGSQFRLFPLMLHCVEKMTYQCKSFQVDYSILIIFFVQCSWCTF